MGTLCGITFTNHLSTTVCTAAADTINFYTEATCTTAATTPGTASTAATQCVAAYFAGTLSLNISAVVSTHTVADLVAPATTTTGGKTLVAGAMAALSMMYL